MLRLLVACEAEQRIAASVDWFTKYDPKAKPTKLLKK